MNCLECGNEVPLLDNRHLVECCGLTLQEYAIRHRLPLDLLVGPDQLNVPPRAADFPPVARTPGEPARAVLEGLRMAGLLRHERHAGGEFCNIPGDIRSLDLLLWTQARLGDYGFRFRQSYEFDQLTNRVVARNRLTTLQRNLYGRPHDAACPTPPPDFATAVAVCLAQVAELQAGYLFVGLASRYDADDLATWLAREHGVAMRGIGDPAQEPVLLRTLTLADGERLFAALEPALRTMPGVWERFHARTPEVTVAKEVVFDSAHFITDHPAKCSNLHGGRYVLRVKLHGRIDPATGCVVDYGYLKKVVTREVVDLFDHHHLNYVAGELAWRSTTEMLCVFIWERLIEQLPALAEIELHETPQSWCRYSGPTLAEFQTAGSDALLGWFSADALGRSPWRAALRAPPIIPLRATG